MDHPLSQNRPVLHKNPYPSSKVSLSITLSTSTELLQHLPSALLNLMAPSLNPSLPSLRLTSQGSSCHTAELLLELSLGLLGCQSGLYACKQGVCEDTLGEVETLGATFLAGWCQLLFECIQQVFSKFESIRQVGVCKLWYA